MAASHTCPGRVIGGAWPKSADAHPERPASSAHRGTATREERAGAFSFPDGQISAQGLVLFGNPAPYAAPIIGGSGKYRVRPGNCESPPSPPLKACKFST